MRKLEKRKGSLSMTKWKEKEREVDDKNTSFGK
jgi:hypothetical protein